MTPMDSGRTIGDPHGPDISSLLAMTLPFPPGLHISVNILHGFVFDPSWIFWDFEISAPSWRTIGGPHGFLEDNWWPPWILRGQLVTPMDSGRTIGDPPWARYIIPPSYDLTFPSWLAHLSEYPSWFRIRSFLDILGLRARARALESVPFCVHLGSFCVHEIDIVSL